MPIRLWSTVTSQRASRPLFQVTGYATSDLAATGAASTLGSLVDARLQVRLERAELGLRPVVPDRGHPAAPLAQQALEPGGLHDRRVARDRGPVVALPLHAVALRAHAHEFALAERLGRARAEERLVVRLARDDRAREHPLVEETAELRALAVVRADPVGLVPDVVRAPGDRVGLAPELRDPPAVVDVLGVDRELHDLADRQVQLVDRGGAVRIRELPVEL